MKNFIKQNFATVCLLLLFALVIVRTAWLSDDAYITFRTIRNFVNAHSLTYNLGERVQAYTHPLWLLVLLVFTFFTHDSYHTPIVISLAITLVATGVIAWQVSTSQPATVLAITVLILSKAFVDYSTSGLENPLTHLLLAAFVVIYLRRCLAIQTVFLLSLMSALAMLNRMDTILLFIPALLSAFFQLKLVYKRSMIKTLGIVALGFLPIVAWLCFSTLYYGFPYPNTAYAKLQTGITREALAWQGLAYLLQSIKMDPVTLTVIGAALVVVAFKRTTEHVTIALGMLLYLIYIVVIGGDFMSGRFLTAPLMSAVIVISASGSVTSVTTLLPPLLAVLLVGLASPYSPIYSGSDAGFNLQIPDLVDKNGISDERLFYYKATGWLTANGIRPAPDLRWWAQKAADYSGQPVVLQCATGIYGYYIAPKAHIIDPCAALIDPLLARLPPTPRRDWRIGHFGRSIPDGYIETVITGSNQIRDPAVAQFYNKLTLITQGDLFTIERLLTIWKMNTGQYDSLLNESSLLPHKLFVKLPIVLYNKQLVSVRRQSFLFQ